MSEATNDLGNNPAAQEQMDALAAEHDSATMLDQYLDEASAPVVPTDEALNRVRSLVNLQLDLESRIVALEVELDAAKVALAQVQEIDLPSALQQYGMTEVRMEDESRVTIKQEYYATIKDEQRNEAFAWLIENGHADLIKHDVITSFTKGQDDEANRLMSLLEQNDVAFLDKKHVHFQTLRAFVKEQIEAGNPLPLDTFSVHVKQVAKIKREKKAK